MLQHLIFIRIIQFFFSAYICVHRLSVVGDLIVVFPLWHTYCDTTFKLSIFIPYVGAYAPSACLNIA